MSNAYCFFHSVDWDGHASAAVVKKFIPEAIMVPFNYTDPFPFDDICPEDILMFVDVVIQPFSKMKELYDRLSPGNLIVIDHHKSFIESDVGVFLKEKKVLFDTSTVYAGCFPDNGAKYAACELAWIFMTNKNEIPKVIRLLGQYDAWRNTLGKMLKSDISWEHVLAFQFGMRLHTLDYNKILDFLKYGEDSVVYRDTIKDGFLILKYQDNQNEISMEHAFEAKILGYSCICSNTHMRNSNVFKSKWDTSKYDLMVAFSMNADRKWSYSFYTDKEGVDASKVAQIFGGGGHVGAAGCVSSQLIFD